LYDAAESKHAQLTGEDVVYKKVTSD